MAREGSGGLEGLITGRHIASDEGAAHEGTEALCFRLRVVLLLVRGWRRLMLLRADASEGQRLLRQVLGQVAVGGGSSGGGGCRRSQHVGAVQVDVSMAAVAAAAALAAGASEDSGRQCVGRGNSGRAGLAVLGVPRMHALMVTQDVVASREDPLASGEAARVPSLTLDAGLQRLHHDIDSSRSRRRVQGEAGDAGGGGGGRTTTLAATTWRVVRGRETSDRAYALLMQAGQLWWRRLGDDDDDRTEEEATGPRRTGRSDGDTTTTAAAAEGQ